MSLTGKLLLVLVLTSTHLFALGIVMVDPTFGLFGVDPVTGDPLKYAIQNASLMGPSTGSGPFTLIVNTNYGVPLPGSPDVIPSFTEQGFATLWMGDFLIQQGANFLVSCYPLTTTILPETFTKPQVSRTPCFSIQASRSHSFRRRALRLGPEPCRPLSTLGATGSIALSSR